MKQKNIILTLAAIAGLFLSSCNNEEKLQPDKQDLPGAENVAYDEMNSTKESIAVVWDADKAINAGATSFTVQIVPSVDAEGDIYDSSTSQNIKINLEEGQFDMTQFTNLTEGKIFYVRIRANYPGARYSKWVFATNDEGKPARIKVGTGIVSDDEVEDMSSAVAKVGYISESTAVAEWSISNFKNPEADKKATFLVEVCKDEACQTLEVSYQIGNIWKDYPAPKFQFTGLAPATDYFLRVKEILEDEAVQTEWSPVVKFTTAASHFKELQTAPANEGDVILFQDFHELLWGGDMSRGAFGYSSTARGSDTEIWKAQGTKAETAMKDKGFYFVTAGTEMGLFNTLGNAIPSTSLKDWGWMAEENNIASIAARAGQAKLGAQNKAGWMTTPLLACLPKPATVEFTFKAIPVDDDPGTVIVELLDGAAAGERNQITPASRVTAAQLTLDRDWKEYTVSIDNVSAASRIAIGGDRNGVEGQHRFCLDDVQIKVVKFGATAVELTVPEGLEVSDVAEKTAKLSWTAVSGAGSYVIAYRIKGAAEWTEVTTAVIPYAFEGLTPGSEYEVKVKAVAGESESAYSEPLSFTTKAAGGKIVSKLLKADESSIAVQWSISDFADYAKDVADQYTIELFEDQALSQLVVKWEFEKKSSFWTVPTKSNAYAFLNPTTSFKFTGLKADKEYYVRISDIDKDINTVVSCKTTPSKFVAMKTSAPTAGEVILHQDFHELLWGGDYSIPAAGYSSNSRTTCSAIWPATGENPTADQDNKKFYLVSFNVEMGLFSTLKGAVPSTSLKDWGWANPKASQQVSARPGYLKFGSNGGAGWVATPALDCLPEGVHSVTLDFDYHVYREIDWDTGAISIEVFSDYTVENHKSGINYVKANEGGSKKVASVPFTEEFKWQHHTETFDVSKGDRIVIGTDIETYGGKHRFFLDNVQIKYVK